MEPDFQREIIRESPETGHGGVGVQVDETGHDEAVMGIKNFSGLPGLQERRRDPDSDDAITDDGHGPVGEDLVSIVQGEDQTAGDEKVNRSLVTYLRVCCRHGKDQLKAIRFPVVRAHPTSDRGRDAAPTDSPRRRQAALQGKAHPEPLPSPRCKESLPNFVCPPSKSPTPHSTVDDAITPWRDAFAEECPLPGAI
jgi:hypothetical protein